MNPGHDRDYALPPRAVAYECMFCHNAYPKIPSGHDEPGTGEYSGTEYPGPEYPAPEDYSSSRAHVTWGRDPADEPGEGDW